MLQYISDILGGFGSEVHNQIELNNKKLYYTIILCSCSYSCGEVTGNCRQKPSPTLPPPPPPPPPPPRPRPPPAVPVTLREKLQMLNLVNKKIRLIRGDRRKKRSIQTCSAFLELLDEFLDALNENQPSLND